MAGKWRAPPVRVVSRFPVKSWKKWGKIFLRLFTIYMEKPVGRWFVQMESKIPILEISVWGGVYHLNNRPNLPKEPRTSFGHLQNGG